MLQLATQEGSYYRSMIEAAKQVLKDTFTVNGQLEVPSISACLRPACDIVMHFSIDMAQQVCKHIIHVHAQLSTTTALSMNHYVHYPHDSQQVGPFYFLTPRKCAIFWCVLRGHTETGKTYLELTKAVKCGKGANSIISILHLFLSTKPR